MYQEKMKQTVTKLGKMTSRKYLKFLLMMGCLLLLIGCGKKTQESTNISVGSLKGPTTIGLVSMMEKAEENKLKNNYSFTMETSADTLLPLIVKGDLDIALVPANVASVLYQKTNGNISVLNINTLGVLYVVSSDSSITSLDSLKGKTIYLTGKGTTPDYVMKYLLEQAGILNEVTLEYKSEPSEVVAILKQEEGAIGLLPQPFATVALSTVKELTIVLDLNEEWKGLQGEEGSRLVTGVTIVRNEFLKEHEQAVLEFMREQKESIQYANDHVKEASLLVEKAGIIEKAAIAEKAIPYCNLTYLDGNEAKTALEGYLKVLFEQDVEAVGGMLPNEDFYYITKDK